MFLGITKNYTDRQVLGVLKGTLQHDLGWNDIDYGNLVFAFQAAYAVGMISMGRLIDRLGTRVGYTVATVFWSLASMGHALANSLIGFIVARSALGFGEAGVFPASLKGVAEWFPKKERALANGIFNAGASVGDYRAARCSLDHIAVRVAMGFCFYRCFRLCLAGDVAGVLPKATGSLLLYEKRAQLHSIRSAITPRESKVVPTAPVQTNLGVCNWQIDDRSHLVVLPLLDTRLLATSTWTALIANRLAYCGHIPPFRCR